MCHGCVLCSANYLYRFWAWVTLVQNCAQRQPMTDVTPDLSGTLSDPTFVPVDGTVLVVVMEGRTSSCPSSYIPLTVSYPVTVVLSADGGILNADLTVGPSPGRAGTAEVPRLLVSECCLR